MGELWNIYDINKNKTGKNVERDIYQLKKGKSNSYIEKDSKKEKSCGCIIINDNKVLLIQQTQGHWGFPKGHIEENETEIETAIREVKEETNLDVEINENKRYTMEYITDKGNLKEVVLFIAKLSKGEIKAQQSEVKEIKWLNFEEAIKTITYNNTKELFNKILQDEKH